MVEDGEIEESKCSNCVELDDLARVNDADLTVTFYDSPFGQYIYQRMDGFIQSEFKRFKKLHKPSASDGLSMKRQSENRIVKVFSGIDFSMEYQNTFPSHSQSFLDQTSFQTSAHTDFDSFLDFECERTPKKAKDAELEFTKNKCFNCDSTDH